MNLLSPITSVMTARPMTLSPTASIKEAGHIFDKYKVHHIPIVLGDELLGMVSKSDYLFFRRGFLDNRIDKRIEDIRLNNYQVSHIMTTGLAKMDSEDKINVALEIFKENLFHAIPVLENGRLIGIVTTHDIITCLARDKEAHISYDKH